MVIKEIRENRDIRNILAVLGTAIICAGLLAFLFVYYYGPSGRYLAGNTILDPAVLEEINYQDKHPRTGRNVHFIFDRMEFSFFDPQKGEVRQNVSLENYQQFYRLIASEKSVEEVTNQVKDLFFRSRPTLLTISMRTQEGAETSTNKIFQIVQLVPDDYFRVQLHEQRPDQGEWAYFYRPHLYQDAMQLFNQPPKL